MLKTQIGPRDPKKKKKEEEPLSTPTEVLPVTIQPREMQTPITSAPLLMPHEPIPPLVNAPAPQQSPLPATIQPRPDAASAPTPQMPTAPPPPMPQTSTGGAQPPQAPPVETPAQARTRQATEDFNKAQNMPEHDENGRWASIGKAAKLALRAFQTPLQPDRHGDYWTDFWNKVAHYGGETIGGAIDPSFDERMTKERELAKADVNLKAAQASENTASQVLNRNSQVQSREERQRLARAAAEQKQLHTKWMEAHYDKTLSVQENWRKFRTEMMQKGYQLDEDQFAWKKQVDQALMDNRELESDRKQKRDEFEREIQKRRLDLESKRVDLYQKALERGENKDEVARQVAELEGNSLVENAQLYDSMAEEEDPDSTEAKQYRIQANNARRMAAARGIKAGTVIDTKPPNVAPNSLEAIKADAARRYPNDPEKQSRYIDFVKSKLPGVLVQ